MKIWYDTEFLDDGKIIDLISIGIVRDDNAEYYAVNANADWQAVAKHYWLCENVVPHLPLTVCGTLPNPITKASVGAPVGYWFQLDMASTLVKPKWVIASEVREFITAVPKPELWGWYPAFDHVVLAQLWGPMIGIPNGIPKRTGDLRQEHVRLGKPSLPSQDPATEHHALHDARYNREIDRVLRKIPACGWPREGCAFEQ